MGKAQIQKNLKIFTKRIKNKFHPDQVLMFGSYARGEATEYSDVDIIIVADSFRSISKEKRLDTLYTLTQDLYPDFHVFGFTSAEFKNVSYLISIAEAKTQSVSLL